MVAAPQRSSWRHIIIIIIIVTVRSETDTRNNNYDREHIHTYLQLQHMYKVKIFIIRDGHTIRRGVFYFGVSQPIPRHDDIWWPPRTRPRRLCMILNHLNRSTMYNIVMSGSPFIRIILLDIQLFRELCLRTPPPYASNCPCPGWLLSFVRHNIIYSIGMIVKRGR